MRPSKPPQLWPLLLFSGRCGFPWQAFPLRKTSFSLFGSMFFGRPSPESCCSSVAMATWPLPSPHTGRRPFWSITILGFPKQCLHLVVENWNRPFNPENIYLLGHRASVASNAGGKKTPLPLKACLYIWAHRIQCQPIILYVLRYVESKTGF